MTAPDSTILLVEDNEINRDMLVRRLQRAGHQVATAGDGEAALIAMRASKKKVTKTHFEEAIGRVRPTVTPEMLEYYDKMERNMTSGLSGIKRNAKDFGFGMESA